MYTEGLIIDEENYKYKVRREDLGYSISVQYHVPRKSAKGYVGSKAHHEEKRIEFKYQAEAYRQYNDWIKTYQGKYDRKEIVSFYVNLMPIVRYYVTCPRCGQDAEILTWMLGLGPDGEEHSIICEHCPDVKSPEDGLFNTVGVCRKNMFRDEEEKNFRAEHHIGGVKWEDWENDKANLCNP